MQQTGMYVCGIGGFCKKKKKKQKEEKKRKRKENRKKTVIPVGFRETSSLQ